MKVRSLIALLLLVPVPACGDGESGGESESSPNEPEPQTTTTELGSVVADLRADTNRDGVVRFDDPSDDTGEDVWTADHGAVFLANIDDDLVHCNSNLNDVDLPNCNDAADEVVNGADDALDLARLKTKPWPNAPTTATAKLTWTASDSVRIFVVVNGANQANGVVNGVTQYIPIQSGEPLTANEIKNGIELAIEARDIVRDTNVWNGFVDVLLSVSADGTNGSDKVRMRVSPLMTYHHVSTSEQTWVSSYNSQGNQAMRADLGDACAAAGVPQPRGIQTTDSWAQDFFEPGFMSMPGANGKQHVIRVNIRSANERGPTTAANPLRAAGKIVWQLRGKDVAGIQEYDAQRNGFHDSLNSFGNLETVPPYTYQNKSYPMGRVIRGSTSQWHPDVMFTKMMEAQKVQPEIYIDTSWLLVGHVDESLSFVKANTARGWKLLINDARMARTMLETQSDAGRGNVPMFVGKYWSSGNSAQATIDEVLSDSDVMSASADGAVEVDGQLAKIKAETGLTDSEIIRIPFLHMTLSGASIAYQPGIVNGVYISDTDFVAPDPHGPVINGKDIFKAAMEDALAPVGVTVHWAEDWDTYHAQDGEVHCGTNSTRAIPDAKWWESGR